jgi:RIO kinase 1
MSQGHFKGLESPISIGKEANIFSAKKEDGSRVMVKIYRLEVCDFNKMYDYIKEDLRYDDLRGKKRKIVMASVKREFRNLMKAREALVRVPKPITFLNNVIIMEFIGKDDDIAPKLKDKVPEDKESFFEDIIDNMKKLYSIGLVHADLSAFNILNYEEKPVFIDFSQACPVKTTRAEEFLRRDLRNILSFFRKHNFDADEDKYLSKILKAKPKH